MKNHENLFQIGQVANICGITRKMLLNYENLGLIKPTETDKNSGYRYFDALSVARIQLILDLRKTGMSLREIGKYLNGDYPFDIQIKKLISQKEKIEHWIEYLQLRNLSQNNIIEVATIQKKYCICREIVAKNIKDAEKEFVKLYGECIELGLEFDQNSYHFCEFQKNIFDEDFFETENIHMRICISINENCAPKDAVIFEETKVAKLCYVGAIENIYSAYISLTKYLNDNNLEVIGYPRELYIEANFDEGGNFIAEIDVPIK